MHFAPLTHGPVVVAFALAQATGLQGSEWAFPTLSTLAASGTLLLTGWIGSMLGNARIGWMSAGVLLSTLMFFDFARSLKPDMAPTFWAVCAIACFVRRATGGPRHFEAGFFGAMAIALLVGGFSGAVVPLLSVMGWNVGQWQTGRTVTRLRWTIGSALTAAIVLVWMVATRPSEQTALSHSISDGLIALFANRAPSPPQLGWSLPLALSVGLLPWLPVAVGAFLQWLALRKSAWRLSPTGWLLLMWIVPTIILRIFTAPWGFNDALPIFPAIALWIAGRGHWRDSDAITPAAGFAGFWSIWWYRVSLLCALALIASPALAVGAAALTLPNVDQLGFSRSFGLLLGFLVTLVCLLIFLWTKRAERRGRDRWEAFETAAGVGLIVIGICLWLLLGSQMDRIHSFLLTS